MQKIKIGNKLIGPDEPCFIIAEAGVNHNGDINLAYKLIDAAKDAGVDAIKFQTFESEEVISNVAPQAAYQKKNTGKSESQLEMVRKLELTKEEHSKLIEYSKKKDILYLSTPFDMNSVDFLVNSDVPLIKIGSGDITNYPFLKYIAKKDLPLILSTGMSTIDEVEDAVLLLSEQGVENLVLLHCTSNYPARIEDCNLRAMETMKSKFHLPIGYSDHTLGIYASIAAVALGACVVEKHFTLDKKLSGPDHKASLDPQELKELVHGIRLVEKSFGLSEKRPVESEINVRNVARRSIVAKEDIYPGTKITEDMIVFKRPGTGISPKDIELVLGKSAKTYIKKDELIQ